MNETTDLTLIQAKIRSLRGQRVMLDFDLAAYFEVPTGALNQAVKRNAERFPEDFVFQLTAAEWQNLKSQNVISSWGGSRKLPSAFTEHGVAMLSGVLRSPKAIEINVAIVRAFVAMRRFAYTFAEVAEKLSEHDHQFSELGRQLADILQILEWLGTENQARHDEIRATRQLPLEWENRERIGYKNAD